MTGLQEEVSYELTIINNGFEEDSVLYLHLSPTPKVIDFKVKDQSTASLIFTNSATVDVAAFTAVPPTGLTIDGYLITESQEEPTGEWPSQPPSTYAITGSVGFINLYAWVKDETDATSYRIFTIYYNTATPVVSNIQISDNQNNTATATWTTDIPADSSLIYRPKRLNGSYWNAPVPENAAEAATSHSVTFDTASEINYEVKLHNNEIDDTPFYWPIKWPILGDANMDCRVNILDLIFIRNKLNLPIGDGDNWKANVQEDGRINILDLIYVRNKLNTSCP